MWSSKMSLNSQVLFLRYSQTKLIASFVSYCLSSPSIVCIFGTNCPISVGFSLNFKQYPNRKCQKKTKNHIFWLQTHFAWSHHIFVKNTNLSIRKTKADPCFPIFWVGQKGTNKHLFLRPSSWFTSKILFSVLLQVLFDKVLADCLR